MSVTLTFQLNGATVSATAAAQQRLMDVLRGPLRHNGTKEGCGNGECGACTVIVDGRAVNACLYPALEAEGRTVLTIEGLLGPGGELSAVQRAFVEQGGIQCGFCSPGMILSVQALLDANADPSDAQIRDALVGNLCRCTGYVQIVAAAREAARMMRQQGGEHV
jgi:carbon-monoxide dehydrogenase small subunit